MHATSVIKVYKLKWVTIGQKPKRTAVVVPDIHFESVLDVFKEDVVEKKLAHLEEKDRVNLYFTCAYCYVNLERNLDRQFLIPIDLDNLRGETEEEVKENARLAAIAACKALKIPMEYVGVIFSGNGVQIFIHLDQPITSDAHFKKSAVAYKAMLRAINAELVAAGVSAKLDPSVWSPSRLMRLPCTLNKKKDRPTRRACVLSGNLVPVAFDMDSFLTAQDDEELRALQEGSVQGVYKQVDAEAIMKECGFMGHVRDNPNSIAEPEWYAALSILARAPDGRKLCHQISQGYEGYDEQETDMKIDQALENAGPRTCENISTYFDGCKKCPHWGKVVSPITLKGENFIASEALGFREQKIENGVVKSGKPVYPDLIKKFSQDFYYMIEKNSRTILVFNGKHWQEMADSEILIWLNKKMDNVSGYEGREFLDRVRMNTTVTSMQAIQESSAGKINLSNCVLDVAKKEILQHAPEHGFMYVLDYPWEQYGECPTWDSFMLDFCQGDVELVQFLEEYAGYCLSGDECWLESCLLIVGEGNNGKSVFVDTLRHLAGVKNVSSVPIQKLKTPTDSHLLVHKLFNISDETHERALMDAEFLKSLVTGGTYQVKKLYRDQFEVQNRTKFIILSNHLPIVQDRSDGFFRRLLMFNVRFKLAENDPRIDRQLRAKLVAESSAILYKLVQAYIKVKERNYLVIPKAIKDTKEAFKEETDHVAAFVAEELEINQSFNERTFVADVYQTYKAWCQAMGYNPFGTQKLTRILDDKYKAGRCVLYVGKSNKVGFKHVKLLR